MPPIRAADSATRSRTSKLNNDSQKISESRKFKQTKAEANKLYTEWADLMAANIGKGMNLVR